MYIIYYLYITYTTTSQQNGSTVVPSIEERPFLLCDRDPPVSSWEVGKSPVKGLWPGK